MLDKVKILETIDSKLTGTDKFLVDLKISTDNRISVFIDGDNGITIDDCIELSRAIEKSLDRDEEDFELNVSSSGIESPLKLHRQYVKNIGRQIKVILVSGNILEGKLIAVNENEIQIELQPEKRKGRGKKEEKQQDNLVGILFNDIQESKIKVVF